MVNTDNCTLRDVCCYRLSSLLAWKDTFGCFLVSLLLFSFCLHWEVGGGGAWGREGGRSAQTSAQGSRGLGAGDGLPPWTVLWSWAKRFEFWLCCLNSKKEITVLIFLTQLGGTKVIMCERALRISKNLFFSWKFFWLSFLDYEDTAHWYRKRAHDY